MIGYSVIIFASLQNSLGDLELFAVLFGALIHDYEHTGHTNSFHIQSGYDRTLALYYLILIILNLLQI